MPEDILVSVVMPTYNDAEYLRQAIDSILSQTYSHFEFIIVNDGSTDNTEAIISTYTDLRIRYYANDTNRGNAYTRNVGMSKAHGKYIAIMDSDDISMPDRLQVQVKYLEKHEDIDILGGAVEFFDGKTTFVKRFAVTPDYTKSFLFFKNAMFQPSVMLRRDSWEKHGLTYDPSRENMEDFDLWFRAAMAGARLSSLDKVLLRYRVSESQLSHPSNLEGRNRMLKEFFRERLALLGVHLPENEFELLHSFIRGRIEINKAAFEILTKNLNKLEQVNTDSKLFEPVSFRAALFFFRLRLIKYYFLEKGRRAAFLAALARLLWHTGYRAVRLFYRNETKNLHTANQAGFLAASPLH